MPSYAPGLSGTSLTHEDGSVEIGPDFFDTPGLLASVIGHEIVHTHQLAEGRWYLEEQGIIMNENQELADRGFYELPLPAAPAPNSP